MAKGRGRLGWVLGIGAGAVLALALLIFAAARPPLSNKLIGWAAASQGLAPVKVSGAHLGFYGVRIGAAALGHGPDIALSDLRVAYTPLGLVRGHIESVSANSVSIVAAYENGALKLPVVGKLGGTSQKSGAALALPRIDVKSLSVRMNGLAVPVTARGSLSLVPEKSGVKRLTFAGEIGAPSPLKGRLAADLETNGDTALNAEFARAPGGDPVREVPRIDISSIAVRAHLSNKGLDSANGTIALASGALREARFGAGRADFVYAKSAGGTLGVNLGDISLTETAAARLRNTLAGRITPVAVAPPLNAYRSDIDTLLALVNGTGSVSADLGFGPSRGTAATWHIKVNAAEAKLAPDAGKPLVIDVTPSDAGPAEIDLSLKGDVLARGDVGLRIISPAPSLQLAGARFVLAGGEAQARLQSLVLTGLAVDWPSKPLTLGLKADALAFQPAAAERLKLTNAVIDADGTLADGVRARKLKLAFSGGLDVQGKAVSFMAENGCAALTFAALTASAQSLQNGALQVCPRQAAPLVSFDPGRAVPLGVAGRLKGGAATLDMAGSGKLRLASLSADVSADLGKPPPSAELSNVALRIVDAKSVPRFAPVDVSGAATLDNEVLSGSLAASALGTRLVSAKLKGDLAAKTGAIDFDTGKIGFAKGSTPLQTLLPVLGGVVTGASGSVRAKGALSWRGSRLRSNGTLTLSDFGVGTTLGRIEGIDGTIDLNRLVPPRTPGPQTIKVKTADVGLPLTDGEVTLNLPEKFAIEIVNAHWPWAGGTLGVASGAFVPGAKTQHVEMSANGIDLTQIFKLLSIDGLSGTGTIDGSLPIVVRGGDAYIEKGMLKARGEGVLHYKGEAGAAAASKGEGAKLLFTALEDFHYQSMQIGVDGRLNGELTLTMKLHGYNPALYDGHAFDININLQSALADLIIKSTAGLRIPQQIQRSLPGAQ